MSDEITPEELSADYDASKGYDRDPCFLPGWWIVPGAIVGIALFYGLYGIFVWIVG